MVASIYFVDRFKADLLILSAKRCRLELSVDRQIWRHLNAYYLYDIAIYVDTIFIRTDISQIWKSEVIFPTGVSLQR